MPIDTSSSGFSPEPGSREDIRAKVEDILDANPFRDIDREGFVDALVEAFADAIPNSAARCPTCGAPNSGGYITPRCPDCRTDLYPDATRNRVWLLWRIDSGLDYTLQGVYRRQDDADAALAEARDKTTSVPDEYEVHPEDVL